MGRCEFEFEGETGGPWAGETPAARQAGGLRHPATAARRITP